MIEILKKEVDNISNYFDYPDEKVNIVYKTYNLTKFKSISGNRIPNLKHIKRLTDSFINDGVKCSPIIVNENFEVIDGQHRLNAAKGANTFIYYIVLNGYSLKDVHTLNLNQRNFNKWDYLVGYAEMGIESYIKLKKFIEKNKDFSFSDCVSMCSNISSHSSYNNSQQYRYEKGGKEIKKINAKSLFDKGTWRGKDFELAQTLADKIRSIKKYYANYNRGCFVGTMINLLLNPRFDFQEFMHKLKLQPTMLVDCAKRTQYRNLIEDIYNYKRRDKINLKY